MQIYAQDIERTVDRPEKELVGFGKVFLESLEEKTMEITVNTKDLALYDVTNHDWTIESGNFKLLIGTSSRSILCEKTIIVQ